MGVCWHHPRPERLRLTPFHWCCRTCDSPNYYWIISSSRRKLALETDAGCLVLSRNHMKATPCLLVRHKHRHTNHHAAASLPFDFVSVPLGATHDTNATRPATSTTPPPCPPPTRCAGGPARTVACEAEYFSGSSSSLCRRRCVWVVQELPQMPHPAENRERVSAPW